MNAKIKIIRFISITLVIMFTLFTACGKASQKSGAKQQSEKSKQQSNTSKVPSELINLEYNIEMVVNTLGGPAVQTKENTQGDKSQQGDQSGQQGQGQKQSQSSGTPQQPQQTQDPMAKIVPIVNTMHYQWNNLMPVAVKKGAKKDLVNNFDNELNRLSKTVIDKNKSNTLMAANRMYSYIPDLFSLFGKSAFPEIKRMRYYSRNVILNSSTANWTQVDSDIANLKSIWLVYKNSLSKEKQDMIGRFDASIYELEKVAKERNQTITDIKGRVAFSNIEVIEKANVSKTDKGTQSENSQSKNQSSGEQSGSQQSGGGQSGEGKTSGGQSSVYSYIKQLLNKLLKK